MLKQKTVYFREEDLPLWEKIENKAEWLHERLNQRRIKFDDKTVILDGESPLKVEMTAPTPRSNKTCKNGHPLDDRGKCFGKGCKYA